MGRKREGWRYWAPVVILRYWLAQGMCYMNWVERAHRLALEALFFGLSYGVFYAIDRGVERLALSVLCAHTVCMFLNGQVFAVVKHDLCWFSFYRRWPDFLAYVEGIQERLVAAQCRGLKRAEIYGSLSRGKFSESSDLDLRYLALPGFWNGVRVAHLVFLERLRAFRCGFPLDLYMFHSEAELKKKMDTAAEEPIVIYRGDGALFAQVGQLFGQGLETVGMGKAGSPKQSGLERL